MRVQAAVAQFNSAKVRMSLSITLTKSSKEEERIFCSISQRIKSESIYSTTDLDVWFEKLVKLLEAKYQECPLRDSNWRLAHINDLELNINKFSPLSASTFLPLPSKIARKKCVINV